MEHTATYSPEDNKLRLSPAYRLDAEEYNRVKAAGFIWAPKQQIFVAPMWTPDREDLLIEMCGEIDDEDKSLVERAEERAERFEDYSDKREREANAAHATVDHISRRFEGGQPILVGHHSEKKARKDAERIENGMRKAIKLWATSKYWTDRAAGALRHAKYKERPDVRHRRIKGIEADKRKQEKYKAEAITALERWNKCKAETDPEKQMKLAVFIAGSTPHGGFYMPKKEGDAPDFPHRPDAYSALTNHYPNLYAPRTLDEVLNRAFEHYPPYIAHCDRWINHYNNRLAYERAMLDESGGLVAEKNDVQLGGRVLVRGEWCTVLRINRKDGRVCSFRTTRRYVPIVSVEEVQGYEPPSAEDAQATKDAMTKGPLCNYPGERFATMTQEEYDKVHKDSKGTREIAATETTARHRVKICIGHRCTNLPPKVGEELAPHYCDANRRHKYWPVYITDAKRKDPPPIEATPKAQGLPEHLKTNAPDLATLQARALRAQIARVKTVDDLTADMFNHSEETGKIRAGIKWEYADEGEAECYQFDTLDEVKEAAKAYQAQDRMRRVEIVTHTGQYQNMRTLYKWNPQGPDFEGMRATLKAGVKVVSAPQLFPTPADLARRMVEIADLPDNARVLEPEAGTGAIIGEIPSHCVITAVEHNYNLAAALRGRFPAVKVCNADFLECSPNGSAFPNGGDAAPLGTFDAVLMNPPFQNGDDIKHITHALNFLKPGGRLVAICANGPRQGEKLRAMVDQYGGEWEELPEGTFKEQGTSVRTVLLSLTYQPAPCDVAEMAREIQSTLF